MNEFQSNIGNGSTVFDSSSREEPVLGTRDCLAMDFMASNKPTPISKTTQILLVY